MRSSPRAATEREKRILRAAARNKEGRLRCPPEADVRIYMSALAQMSRKGYIYRAGRIAYITTVGIAVAQ